MGSLTNERSKPLLIVKNHLRELRVNDGHNERARQTKRILLLPLSDLIQLWLLHILREEETHASPPHLRRSPPDTYSLGKEQIYVRINTEETRPASPRDIRYAVLPSSGQARSGRDLSQP